MDFAKIKQKTWIHDFINVIIFVVCVIIGTIFINTFIFRSFNVVGPSMETTLYTNDRLIVNRIVVTIANIQGKEYMPERGQIIVFKNPAYTGGNSEEHIVKRVIGLPGDRVVLRDGKYTIYNSDNPDGFNPDTVDSIGTPTNGSGDWIVPDNEVFVSGDHRQGNYSYDSRNGLGMIPLYDIVGPVSLRLFPFNKICWF